MDSIYCGLGTEDGSIFLVGETFDSTEEDLGGGTPLGLGDIVAFKLHINGTELWKWQVRRGEGWSTTEDLEDPLRAIGPGRATQSLREAYSPISLFYECLRPAECGPVPTQTFVTVWRYG